MATGMDGIGNHHPLEATVMQIYDADWKRLEKVPTEDEQFDMLTAGSWNDRGVTEQLFVKVNEIGARALYRKRFWFRSSMASAGEVWFIFKG